MFVNKISVNKFGFEFSFMNSYAKINYSFYTKKTSDLQHKNGLSFIGTLFEEKQQFSKTKMRLQKN